jgi:hypothetical protein
MVLAGALAVVAAVAPARADISVEGGALVTRAGTSGAGALSLGVFSLPVVPLSTELTVADGSGGYAATFDARIRAGGTTAGAGIGFGSLGHTSTTSGLYDVLIAQQIVPHTAIEARMYFGPNRPSSLFAGLRLSF